MRHSDSAYPVLNEPLHRMISIEIHGGSHDGVEFVKEVFRGQSAITVFLIEVLQKSLEAGVWGFCARLAQHFTDHMNRPRALGIDQNFETVRGFGRFETVSEGQRANIRSNQIGIRQFLFYSIAIAFEPNPHFAVWSLLAVRKEQSAIIGESFINPLVAITGPAYNVAPPLVCHFVKGNELAEVFLI